MRLLRCSTARGTRPGGDGRQLHHVRAGLVSPRRSRRHPSGSTPSSGGVRQRPTAARVQHAGPGPLLALAPDAIHGNLGNITGPAHRELQSPLPAPSRSTSSCAPCLVFALVPAISSRCGALGVPKACSIVSCPATFGSPRPSFWPGCARVGVGRHGHGFPPGPWARHHRSGGKSRACLPARACPCLPKPRCSSPGSCEATCATLQEDYILAARAKGMPTWHILAVRPLRGHRRSPLITLAGLSVGRLIGGTIIVEQIFSLPGVGSVVINAARRRLHPCPRRVGCSSSPSSTSRSISLVGHPSMAIWIRGSAVPRCESAMSGINRRRVPRNPGRPVPRVGPAPVVSVLAAGAFFLIAGIAILYVGLVPMGHVAEHRQGS